MTYSKYQIGNEDNISKNINSIVEYKIMPIKFSLVLIGLFNTFHSIDLFINIESRFRNSRSEKYDYY